MATTALDFLFDHYWKASLLLGIGVSSLKNFNQGAIMGSICRTQNFRAWYNAVEVEQEI
jgi:coproporphyrinogen III oxidase-like Fe-S oxidoreductase